MRILFDQGTPVAIRRFLTGHSVRTTRQESWTTLTNGSLLRVAEEAKFDLLLTTDNSLAYQQNLADRWQSVQRMIPKIVAAVDAATPGSYAVIDIPVR
jgi:hypothetical protein